MSRKYPARPILAAGAVVVENGRALLVRRGNEPAKGAWSIPGGAVEPGETLREAARREIFEETGLLVDVGDRLAVLERIFRDPGHKVKYHYLLIDYRAVATSGELRAGSDAADARFFTGDEILKLGLADITLEVVRKALTLEKK